MALKKCACVIGGIKLERIDECYKSLKAAEDDVNMLNAECDKLVGFMKDYLIIDSPAEKYTEANALLDIYQDRISRKKKKFIFIGGFYLLFFAVMMFFGVVINKNPAVIISMITSALVSVNISDVRQLYLIKGKRKFIQSVLEYCQERIDCKDLSIDEIIALINTRNKELGGAIEQRRQAIPEYERLLEKAQVNIADEILADEGIDATIDLYLKTPNKKKQLIKIDVNK